MSEQRKLLELNYHSDDDTGMYEVGEIDYSIPSDALERYIKTYGYKGVEEILAGLGLLAHKVMETYLQQPPKSEPPEASA